MNARLATQARSSAPLLTRPADELAGGGRLCAWFGLPEDPALGRDALYRAACAWKKARQRSGIDILVATPGRLLDHHQQAHRLVDLDHLSGQTGAQVG